MAKFDGLNAPLLLQVSQLWLKKYADSDEVEETQFLRHKKNLFQFFKDYSNHVNDSKVHRLVCRVKQLLGEPAAEVKECKLKEIRSLQIVDWQVRIEECEEMERALLDLVKLFEQAPATDEERAFVKTNAVAIEDCLKRKVKEDLVARFS